jgi:hypothetical protein
MWPRACVLRRTPPNPIWQSGACNFCCTSSSRESLSRRAITRLFSANQLPVRAASSLSFVMISNGRLKPPVKFVLPLLGEAAWTYDQASLKVTAHDEFLNQQSCHDRLTGARIVGSRKRSGWRGSIASYTAVIWCGSGSTSEVWTASTGSKRCAKRMRFASETSRKRRHPRQSSTGGRTRPARYVARRSDRATRWPTLPDGSL